MEVLRFSDPVAFRERVATYLLLDEARHNLLLGLLATLIDRPEVYPRFHLWVVEDVDGPLGVGLVTPPYNLAVSRPRDASVLAALARAVHKDGIPLPGITGALPEAEELVSAWQTVSGQKAKLRMAQRIYQLRSLRPGWAAPGSMRRAGMDDLALVVSWVIDFVREAGLGHDQEEMKDMERRVGLRLTGEGAGYFLWEDGGPVSLAGYGGFTPHGVQIGPVYTPPPHRGRGYASALTASASAWLLGQGRQFCFLYTDQANPTSNRIYQRLGYEPVCDSAEYRIERTSA